MLNNIFLICLGLYCRWGIYKGRYGRLLDGLNPEQTNTVKKNIDDMRQRMVDDGGFLRSLWVDRRRSREEASAYK